MCRRPALTPWADELQSAFPAPTRPQVKFLAQCSLDMSLAGRSGPSCVAAALVRWLRYIGQSPTAEGDPSGRWWWTGSRMCRPSSSPRAYPSSSAAARLANVHRPAISSASILPGRLEQELQFPLRERCVLPPEQNVLPPHLEPGDDAAGERLGRSRLPVGQLPGRPVDHAQRPDRMPVGHDQRDTRVEPQERLAGHQRVVGEPRVGRRVGHLEHPRQVVQQNRVLADRHVGRRLGHFEADPGLEPLPVGFDQRNERHQRPADGRRRLDQVLRQRVEDLRLVLRRDPGRLVPGRLVPGRRSSSGRGGGWRGVLRHGVFRPVRRPPSYVAGVSRRVQRPPRRRSAGRVIGGGPDRRRTDPPRCRTAGWSGRVRPPPSPASAGPWPAVPRP